MTPLTPEQTHAYLHHIGIDDPGPPSLANLDRLIDAHLRRVAFENLDVLLDRPIEIDADKVFAKVVEGSRGGYCFELNSLFARLLLALGYELELLVARVRWGLPEDAPLTQQSHLMLRLYLAEGEFLVDVGFGSANPPRALPLPGDEATPDRCIACAWSTRTPVSTKAPCAVAAAGCRCTASTCARSCGSITSRATGTPRPTRTAYSARA